MFLKNLKEFNLPELEERILEFWKKNQVFEDSLRLAEERGRYADARGKKSRKRREFVFFEGPPTANGRPGIHHVIGRAFKDIIPRYKTMQGYQVPRTAGWDTHGLPVEIEVEKELGLESKKDIEKYGIAKFNQRCRESVWRYKEEWEKLTERVGFWLDFKNPYITYETNYIETLWWIISQIAKRKLLYKGHKVVPWCTRCGTALSSHEMAQGYKEVLDKAVYVKFKVRLPANGKWQIAKGKNTYILSWTTTPWTLPGNVALAVGEKIDYVMLEVEALDARSSKKKEIQILAKDRVGEVGVEGKVIGEVKGKDLVGLSYEPLFSIPKLKTDKSYKVYPASFVTTTDGTGVVHTAVMYGEDDYELGTKLGLPKHHTVDERGFFLREVAGLGGKYVKDDETEEDILEYLKKKGSFFSTGTYEHEYPFCWRCDTPLLYYARESWFVAMSKLRPKLLAANKLINWVPEHFKNGRFGGWLKEVKDWNFSRERYWGTPIPTWHCKKCDKYEVVGSLKEVNEKSFGSRNDYWVMRHGESEANMLGVIDVGQGKYHLTDRGKEEAEHAAEKLKRAGIDIIVASPVLRTKETEEIAAGVLKVKKVIIDDRLHEIKVESLRGRASGEYGKQFPTYESRFLGGPGAESLREVRTRIWDLFQELERKYKGKQILLVSHEYPIWMIAQVTNGWTEKQAIAEKEKRGDDFVKTGELMQLDLKIVPRDETGEVNLHRPYVDEIALKCSRCGGETLRIKELADVWFDSGSMPYARWHYPFENREKIDGRGILRQTQDASAKRSARNIGFAEAFPADYIAEAVDQTRGWFYTLLAVSVLLGHKNPFKNVICYGHVLDKHGKKMSKSKGNIVDPWVMAEKYGMDAVRWHFFTGSPPGEPRNFDEQDVLKTYRRFHLILYNSLVFYLTYADKKIEDRRSKIEVRKDNLNILNKSINLSILDQWILARLGETVANITRHLNKYEVREAALAIEGLTDDLSRWYIRRSRRRFQKPESKEDHRNASVTLGYVLREIGKLTAPFCPFFAEVIWGLLDVKGKKLDGKSKLSNVQHLTSHASVHLEEWPISGKTVDVQGKKLLKAMVEVRRLASLGLALRAKAGIKVRQPLRAIRIKNKELGIGNNEFLTMLAEEVNVKKIIFDLKIKGGAELDTKITAELKEEGIIRELTRAVQELRQKAGMEPRDEIVLMIELPKDLEDVVSRNESLLKKEVGAERVDYKKSSRVKADLSTKVDEKEIWVGIRKV